MDSESASMKARLDNYNQRLEIINAGPGNPAEVGKIMDESASGFDLYAERLASILPEFERNLTALTESFSAHIKLIDQQTKEGQDEIAGMRKEAKELTQTFNATKGTLRTLRDYAHSLYKKNYSQPLSRAAFKLVRVVEKVIASYEDFETFSLTISFLVDEKSGQDGQGNAYEN